MSDLNVYITDEEYSRAAKNGISYATLNSRVRVLCWDKEKAITTPLVKSERTYNKEFVEKAKLNGISYGVYRHRIIRGWSEEAAATTPVLSRSESLKRLHNSTRKYPKEIIELAEKNNISYSCFWRRVKDGMTMEEASTKPPLPAAEAGKRGGRKSYKKTTKYPEKYLKMAKDNGIPYTTFRRRYIDGMTMEEAATKPLMPFKERGVCGGNAKAANKKSSEE